MQGTDFGLYKSCSISEENPTLHFESEKTKSDQGSLSDSMICIRITTIDDWTQRVNIKRTFEVNETKQNTQTQITLLQLPRDLSI